MRRKYLNIIIGNAKKYELRAGVSFLGALLKTSLVPLELFERYIPRHAKILDLGCGEGMLSNALSKLLPHAKLLTTKLVKLSLARPMDQIST